MADESIESVLNGLPQSGVTVYALKGLDFVVPGEWGNCTNFDEMIRSATGEEDPSRRYAIAVKAKEIYADESTGFQRALWLYQMTDKADFALGSAAMAAKVGEKISFLSFLDRLTPQADTTQTIDLAMKIVVEMLAFSYIQGLPRDRESIAKFAGALKDHYKNEALMRMAALVCLDGIIPLGPDFVMKCGDILQKAGSGELTRNPLFSTIGKIIPGGSSEDKFGFISSAYRSVQGWMDNLLTSRGLTTEKVTDSLRKYVEFTDDKLDYLAAFFDMSTNYYAHTGAQSVARYAIMKAHEQMGGSSSGLFLPSSGAAVSAGPMDLGAPPPPPGGGTQQAAAIYDYMATSPANLSVSKGEALTINGGDQGGWFQATNARGQTGWVPASYIKLGAAPSAPAGPRTAVLSGDNYGSTLLARAGEMVSITGDEQGGWYWGTTANGQSGWIVASLVKFQ